MSFRIRSTAAGPFIFAFILASIAVACGGDDANPTSPGVNVPYSQTDLRVGTGAEATAGRRVTVHYTLWLYESGGADNKGRQLQSSVDAAPFSFTLGRGEVIRGWDQGVVGMRAGGQRRLIIPPALAYGAAGSPPLVPPNATLVFDIELLDVS